MNKDVELMIGLALAPDLVELYETLAEPLTVDIAARRLRQHDSDVDDLCRRDEPAALEAALVLRRFSALQLAAVATTSVAALKTKHRRLASLADDPASAWLTGPMLEAAWSADVRRLGLSPRQAAEIRTNTGRRRRKS